MSLAQPVAKHSVARVRLRGTSVLAQAALVRAAGVGLVLLALWLAVAWAVAVP